MATLKKGDEEILIYGFDWSDWLVDDTIATSTWRVPVGLSEVSTQSNDTIASIKLGGGTIDESYEVVNIITTATSTETAERTLRIVVVSDKYK